MKKNSIFLILGVLLFVACNANKKEVAKTDQNKAGDKVAQVDASYVLLKKQCYVCHSIDAPSHDDLIAPPMAAVKMRYMNMYDNKDDFVAAVAAWVMNPDSDKALMRGAVTRFKVMPKQNFNEDEIKLIAAYMYDHKLEEPDWFEAHQQEMHGDNGMGRGKGMRGNK
ncbi:MAG: c-type cytochrome [Flavobacteriaceae bacterium]|nr:c-type cytochrome [Flavobacteriaceae bacterium]